MTGSETPLPTGYPHPVVKHFFNVISGFFLEDSVYNDVAVLSVPSFGHTDSTAEKREFQNVLHEFLAKAKLIIDLQANGGGSVPLGVELFAQLFPSLTAYSGHNIRATEVNEVLGQTISGLNTSSQTYKLDLDLKTSAHPEALVASTPYNYRQDVLPDRSATMGHGLKFLGRL